MASSRRASVAFAAFLLATYLVLPASPYSMGAPQGACKDGVPQHGVPPQNGPSPYRISVSADAVESSPGQYISVRLAAGEEPFIGFLLQARNVTTGEMAGKFLKENPSDDHLLLACDNLADAVTHSHKREKREVSLRWEAPPGSSGDVTFSSTFVRGKDKFWVGVESPKVRIERAVSAEVETPTEAPTQTPPAKEGGRNPSLGLPPGLDLSKTPAPEVKKSPSKSGLSDLKDHAVYEGCGKSKGCFGEPDNCLETKDCQMFVTYALSSNAESYHFEIQGFVNVSRNDGYIAVGISSDPFMGNDAVVACVTHESRVKPLRGFNIPNDKSNRMTTEQQTGLSNFQGSLRDTTLYCSFDIEPEFYATADNISSPFHLAKNEYYLLLASGPVRDADHIDYHVAGTARTRKATALAANLVEAADDMLFVRLHGSFMFGAWIGSASLGMMFARYFKTTWSNSQLCKKDIWFRFHQLFMITTWGLTMAGFVLIFLALGGWSFTKNPHPILGCVTTGLCFLQPIGALFRPAPDSKRRPIFNWLHWFGGNAAQIVGIVAMFFAVDLQRARLPEFTWWILVAFVAFHGLVHFILSIVQCVSENRGRENRADVYPMKDMGVGQSYYYPQTKQDAAGGGLRKFLLAIYFIVNAAFTAVLVLMVVFAPIEKTLEKWNLHNIF